MATPTPEFVYWGPQHIELGTTKPLELVDVTDRIADLTATSGVARGIAHAFCPHTSCGLTITEAEDGLHEDIDAFLERLAPTTGTYVHDDMTRRTQNREPDERRNGWSHLRALVATTPTLVLPVVDHALALGTWQRIFLVELDGPRSARRIALTVQGADC